MMKKFPGRNMGNSSDEREESHRRGDKAAGNEHLGCDPQVRVVPEPVVQVAPIDARRSALE